MQVNLRNNHQVWHICSIKIQFLIYLVFFYFKGLEKFVTQGLVRSLGVSNFNSAQRRQLHSKVNIKPAVNQVGNQGIIWKLNFYFKPGRSECYYNYLSTTATLEPRSKFIFLFNFFWYVTENRFIYFCHSLLVLYLCKPIRVSITYLLPIIRLGAFMWPISYNTLNGHYLIVLGYIYSV